jgi:zinc protease
MKRQFLALAAAALLLQLLSAVPSGAQAVELSRQQALVDKGSINQFAKDNLGSFTIGTLDNGIPVVIKRSTTNRILTVKAVLRGHVSFTPVQKAGLEAVMLRMLAKGSARYPYAEVQRALFEKSSALSASYTSFDMTSLDLITIDTYFDEMFGIFADAFLHPSWNAEEFPRVINDFKLAKQQAENDPFSLAVQLLHEGFFAGHPYEAIWDGAGYSLENITLADVKDYYTKTVTSGRLFLVAVGNFDPPKLLAKLNATFGTIPKSGYTRPALPSFEGKVKPDLSVETFPQSEGLAYVRGDFALPAPDSADYPAILVAFSLLDDLLFEIVRTRNGACYSVWSTVHGFTASYGDITVFKTAVPGKVKPLVDEAIGVLASGRSMGGRVSASAEGKSGIGTAQEAKSASFVPLADALPFYKDQFLTKFYSGEQTNISIAAQIASSIVYRGDYRDFLLMIDRIRAVTPDDVVRAVKRYLVNAPTRWIALGDPAVLKDVKKEDFIPSAGK